MKILVLSFYYEPDLSAGSFRVTPLVRALVAQLPVGAHVDVITTVPNRYSSFTVEAPERVDQGQVTVMRLAVPAHKSGMLDQSKAFVSFAMGALRLVRHEEYALVFATSSRLMTAVLGSWIARRKRAPLYLDIRDIFVDTIQDVLPRKFTFWIKPFFAALERFAIGRATKVNLVSAGFAPYFRRRYPTQEYSFFTNGIDDAFLDSLTATSGTPPDTRKIAAPSKPSRVVNVVYAGNMGEGQGLHAVIPALAKRMEGRVRFRLIGDGGRRCQLEAGIAAAGVGNVDVLAPMTREQLIAEYRAADVLFLHLNDYEAFKKVLPSKIFEYAATGKPMWAGVAGYAADFLREHVDNVAVFAPCDVAGAADALLSLDLAGAPRERFVSQFSRQAISAAMAADVVGVLEANATA